MSALIVWLLLTTCDSNGKMDNHYIAFETYEEAKNAISPTPGENCMQKVYKANLEKVKEPGAEGAGKPVVEEEYK